MTSYDGARRLGALNLFSSFAISVAQPKVFEFRVKSGSKAGKPRKHCTFVRIEIGTRYVWPIKRNSKAAYGIGRRYCEDGSP
jgi:hypothetical protein